ncbi:MULTISPECIES: hypothetical protein [unclassified Methanoculleus]|jgi:hypothetical protein|uniref:Archaeal Type IV pilin N-terminal domain-containing protein n=1 Tax=Methanoculleus palmolei TaxID=72612 RepID=A0ABD8A9Y8_9EURY|nr:hypothetical protein [Methanoculleus sp. UBA377]WOX56337.1 hypothetical protein R6Y95_03120 [Methanoculleus palmolei]
MRPHITEPVNEEGVTRLMEYVIISGVLLLLMIVMMSTVNAVFMEGPADRLRYHAFVDIGNGVSTRIVDLYVIAPDNGTIETKFDIPDEVAGKGYFVDVDMEKKDARQEILVQGGSVKSRIAIAGIGATKGVVGNTTGAGWNRIQYDSKGF